MKKYKEFLYGFGTLAIYLILGIASGYIWLMFSIGFIQAALVTFVLCKLNNK